MGNYMMMGMGNMGNPQNVYLSDRGPDWSCDSVYGGPKFRKNNYNPNLLQSGITQAEYEDVVARADKKGWVALRPCWIVSLTGFLIFMAFMVANLVLGLTQNAKSYADVDAIVCNANTGWNQCEGQNTTDPFTGKALCCNFWCCGGRPTGTEKLLTEHTILETGRHQTPESYVMLKAVREGECFYKKAEQMTEDGRAGHEMYGECNGEGEWNVEGSTYRRVGRKGFSWPWYYVSWLPTMCAVCWVIITSQIYKRKCYRNAVVRVFEEGFAGKVGVSWQTGGKHSPNYVILHIKRQHNFQNQVSVVAAMPQQVSVVAVPQQQTVTAVPMPMATASASVLPVATVHQVDVVQQQPPTAVVGNVKVTPML